MRLYEHEAKKLFSKFAIPVPKGTLVRSSFEAKDIACDLGLPVMLKSQVLTGGRGKAGGIAAVFSTEEIVSQAERLFALKIKGFPVHAVLVEKALELDKELYLGITINRAR